MEEYNNVAKEAKLEPEDLKNWKVPETYKKIERWFK